MVGGIIASVFSGPGKTIMVVFALLAWTAWVKHDAAESARAETRIECIAEVTENTNAEIARQKRVSQIAEQAALVRAAESEEKRNELQRRLDTLVAQAQDAGDPVCIVPDALRGELQRLW